MDLYQKIRFLVRARKYIRRVDPNEIRFMRKVLQPGECAVDIGSHKGAYIYWMQKSVQKTGKVFSFEPQLKLFNYLKYIIKIFKYKQVEVFNYALSDSSGIKELHAPAGRVSTGATLVSNLFDENDAVFEINSITLDEFFEKENHKVYAPNFIKIDVESHELEVLQGAGIILMEARPVIQFEAEQRVYGDRSITSLFDHFQNFKYKGYFFFNNLLESMDVFDLEKHQPAKLSFRPNVRNYANNFIFIPEEKVSLILNRFRTR